MGNITDDIRQHFDTFAELPFTEADSLALSQLAYARMPDNVPRYHENAETADGMIATVPIHDLLRAECYDDMFGKVWSPSMNVDLLRAMSESPRWRNLRVGAYVDEFDAATTKQFSACVFELGNGTLYVAFRGTDSSIVGWKEDFMMAFRRPVASQEAAACISSSRCFVFSHVFFSGLGSCMHFPYFSGCAEVFLPNMRASLTRRLWPVNSRSRPWCTMRSMIAAASLSSAKTVPHLLNSMFVVNMMLRLS